MLLTAERGEGGGGSTPVLSPPAFHVQWGHFTYYTQWKNVNVGMVSRKVSITGL